MHRRRRLRALFALLVGACALGAASSVPAEAAWTSRVLCARSPDGAREVWLSARDGLVLETASGPGRPSATLALGPGAWPRFRPDGRLVFEVGRDDGHRLLAVRTRVLDPGSVDPRDARPGEALGRWLPLELPATGPGVVRVALDPGHGGADVGATAGALSEKTLALQLALELAERLATDTADANGGGAWEVLLTRVGDDRVSLQERACMARAFGAQAVLSWHAEIGAARGGVRTTCHAERAPSAVLRDRIHARIQQLTALGDRGVGTSDSYLLRELPDAAVQLSVGVLDQPGDAALLSDADTLTGLVLGSLFALQEQHGVSIHEPSLFTLVGGGTYGEHGKPSLLVQGSLLPGSKLTLRIIDGAWDASGVVAISWASQPLPFLDGLLFAYPIHAQLAFTTDAAGSAVAQLSWPRGVPAGTQLWLQVVVDDLSVVPWGATLSDAQEGVTP